MTKARPQGYGTPRRQRWWATEEQKEVLEDLIKTVAELDDKHVARRVRCLRQLREYRNDITVTFDGNVVADITRDFSRNPLQNLGETFVSRVGSRPAFPEVFTSGGDVSQQTRGENLNKFQRGFYQQHDAELVMTSALRDSLWSDLGVVKVYHDGESLQIMRIHSAEMLWDYKEAKYGNPRTMYHQRAIAKDVAIELWPEFAEQIEHSKLVHKLEGWDQNGYGDCITIFEAYHIGPRKSENGRHVLAITEAILSDEPWQSTRLPYVFVRSDAAVNGITSDGLVRQSGPQQRWMNECISVAIEQLRCGGLKIIYEEGAINEDDYTNGNGTFVKRTRGQPDPIISNPPVISPELAAQIAEAERAMSADNGISQLSSQGLKPSGINSGTAQRTYYDLENERFASVIKMWSYSWQHLALRLFDAARMLAEENPDAKIEIMAKDKNGVELIDWADAALDDDQYTVMIAPTNFFSNNPAFAKQDALDAVQLGLMGQEDLADALQFPDISSISHRRNAARRIVAKDFEAMLDRGESRTPDPMLIIKAQYFKGDIADRYFQAKDSNYDAKNLDLARQYMEMFEKLCTAAAPPSSPPVAPPGIQAPEGQPPQQ